MLVYRPKPKATSDAVYSLFSPIGYICVYEQNVQLYIQISKVVSAATDLRAAGDRIYSTHIFCSLPENANVKELLKKD